MQWYWVLLMVVVTQGVFLLVLWLLLRKQQPTGDEALQAERSKVARLEEEAKAEKAAKEKVAAELQRFAEESRQVQEWYNGQKDKLSQEAKDEFQKLASDPSELDRRLAAALGAGPADTPG